MHVVLEAQVSETTRTPSKKKKNCDDIIWAFNTVGNTVHLIQAVYNRYRDTVYI